MAASHRWAMLAQHGVSLYSCIMKRYYYLTWLLTLLVAAVWVHDEGSVLLRRRFPSLAKRLAASGERGGGPWSRPRGAHPGGWRARPKRRGASI